MNEGASATSVGTPVHEQQRSTWGRRAVGWVLRTGPLERVGLERADWLFLAAVFLGSRLLILVLSLVATAIFPQIGPHGSFVYAPLGLPGQDVLARLYAHFDSGWYIGISHGYFTPASGRPDWLVEWGFFPLYPLALHPVDFVLSLVPQPFNTGVLAGVLVSHAALFASMVLLFRLAAAELSPAAARRTVVYLAAFPTSYVLSSVYPEGLFLLLTVGAFLAARRRSWPVAGILTALALLTRAQGLFLALPLLLEFAAAHHAAGHRWRDVRVLRGLWLVVPPIVALGGYALYSHAQTGDWLAFSVAQATLFGHRPTPPVYPLLRFVLAPQIGGPTSFDFGLANFAGAVVFLALIVVAWRRLPPAYTLWLALCVLFPLSTNGHNLSGFVRYMAPTFPAVLALAAWSLDERWAPAGSAVETRAAPGRLAASARELRDRLVLAPSLVFLAVWVIMFVNGYYGAA
jgi:hypothetical protein